MVEPDNLVLTQLRGLRDDIADLKINISNMRSEMTEMRATMVTRAEFQSEINSLRADVASDMLLQRREFNEKLEGLRHTVFDYHASVVGHGHLIDDLDTRMHRVERHLDLPEQQR